MQSNETLPALTVEFLNWIASRPRTYSETMEAWRTSCPRHSVWEDALSDGLIQLEDTASGSTVQLTDRGKIALNMPSF